MSKNESKIKLLMLYEILRQKTDENNPLSTTQLIEELKNKGVNVSRKILAEEIALLNQFGYEVLSIRSKSNLYFVVERKFEIAELKILIDAVESASFITKSKTEVLIDKIANLAGENRAELLKKNIIYFDNVKHTNEGIYLQIMISIHLCTPFQLIYIHKSSLFDIKDRLRHCDIKTTMRYTHDNDKQKEVTANIIESIYCENPCPPK